MEATSRSRLAKLASAGNLLVAALAAPVVGQTTICVSADSAGVPGNGTSVIGTNSSVSADGRYVAFSSFGTNLVVGDTNGTGDVFVRDLQSGTTELVSIDSAGAQGNGVSDESSISADGRYVAFRSLATNLVAGGDANNGAYGYDVFVRDRQSGTTELVSVSSAGVQGNSGSYNPSISAGGRYVVFISLATNLVAADTNSWSDVFVRDRQNGTTERVSVDSLGLQANGSSGLGLGTSISADGRYVAFVSGATNLVPGDANGFTDVFVRDRQSGTTELVSVDSNGVQGSGNSGWTISGPAISADGRYVAFTSYADNLVPGDTNAPYGEDVFVHDRQSGTTERVSLDSAGAEGNSLSNLPSISADGRYVGFRSYATNLVAGDTNGCYDTFVRDRQSGTTERVSVDSLGVQANGDSGDYPSLSADGRFVVFASGAGNLVPGDSNGSSDAFRRDRSGCSLTIYCTAKVNSLGCTPAIAFTGTPSASAGSGFLITATNEMSHKNGLLFYGTSGTAAISFQGGYLCVQAPTRLTLLQGSGGTPPPSDCSGQYSYDFNVRIAAGVDAHLAPGAVVAAQYWARDPGFAEPDNTSLTQGLLFTIFP